MPQYAPQTWSAGTRYTAGTHVIGSNGAIYSALTTNSNTDPTTHPAVWQMIASPETNATVSASPILGTIETWASNVWYVPGQLVINSGTLYQSKVKGLSGGTFAGDASKWNTV